MSAAEMPETPPSALEQARAFVARGWRPFPVEYGGKRPAVGVRWGTATATLPEPKTLEWWFGRDPVNVGIAAKGSGLIILDDDADGGMERLCEAYGQPVPDTYRVATSKGWHWYFLAPRGTAISNRPGPLAEFGFDVRGGAGADGQGDGGYVVAAGSLHESGRLYEAVDPDAPTAPLPDWLASLLQPEGKAPRTAGAQEPAARREDRTYTDDQANAWVRRYALEPLRNAEESERNIALNSAAVVFGHFVPEFYPEDVVVDALAEIAEDIGLERREIAPTIRSGLRKGMSEPYTKVNSPDPFQPESSASGEDDPDTEYETALRRERIRRQVRAELDAEDREPLRVLSAEEFLSSPPPDYLVPGMLYRDGLSVVFGPPGAAKSFLVLDIALSLATGVKWRGQELGRGRVHYVMAEGQATNTLRARAWLEHRAVAAGEFAEWFSAIPTAVMLTEAGIRDYLPLVEKDQPDLIILDTKNLMFEGKEAQGDDYGRMLRVLHRLRVAAGGAAVVLIDHSGLHDETRTRGSNAQKGGVETEIRVTEVDGVRRAECTRDKSGEPGAEWLYKLVQVPSVSRPTGVTAPAVCVPVDADETTIGTPFGSRYENWNDPLQPSVPDDVSAYRGPGAAAIKALARFMRYSAGGSVGFALPAARKAVKEVYTDERGKAKWSDDTIDRAWGALVDISRLQVAEGGGSTSRSVWIKHPGDPE